MHYVKNKSLLFLILLLGLSIVTIMPFFHSGFFTMHDDTQVARVSEMFHSLQNGMIPVRWVTDLGYGYGYPIFTFYAPFSYYFGAFWMFFGLDALIATKVMMIFGTVLAGVFMYFFAKDIWGEEGGFIAGLFYLFAPYHAANLYVRGAVAEIWGMAFVPVVFYGLWKTYITEKWRYVFIGSLGYAGVILSHNLTAMMITPFLLGVLAVMKVRCLLKKEYSKLLQLFVMFLLGIALAAFYWLPAIGEMQYTNVISQISGTGSKFTDHFVCLNQLWDSPWGFAGSAPGCIDGISFRIGKLHILFVIVAAFLGGVIYKKNKEKGIIVFGSILFFALSVFLTLQNSEFLWNALSPMSYFQFPWRFLLVSIFFSSFLAGGVIWYVKERCNNKNIIMYGLLGVFVLGLVFLYGKLFVPQTLTDDTSSSLTNEKVIQFKTSKISDEYLPPNFTIPKSEADVISSKTVIISGTGKVMSEEIKSQLQKVRIVADTTIQILLKTAPFPAWKTFLDGQELDHKNTSNGMLITIPAGKHELSLIYVSTKIENIGNFITLTSMMGLLVGIIYLHSKKML